MSVALMHSSGGFLASERPPPTRQDRESQRELAERPVEAALEHSVTKDPFARWRQILPDRSILEANILNRETADLFLNHLMVLYSNAHRNEAVPPARVLFDMQEELLGWVNHASVAHKCPGIQLCAIAKRDPNLHECSGVPRPGKPVPCNFSWYNNRAEMYPSLVLAQDTTKQDSRFYSVTHLVFLCIESGKVHQCRDKCGGDLVNHDTQERTCSISTIVKSTSALCAVHRNMMYNNQGEYIGGVKQWNDLTGDERAVGTNEGNEADSYAKDDEPAYETEYETLEGKRRRTPMDTGAPWDATTPGSALRGGYALERIDVGDYKDEGRLAHSPQYSQFLASHTQSETAPPVADTSFAPERAIFARRVKDLPNVRSDLARGREQLIARSVTEMSVAEHMGAAETQVRNGHKTLEDFKVEKASVIDQMEHKSGAMFDAIALRATTKRRKAQDETAGGASTDLNASTSFHKRCMRLGVFVLIPRNKALVTIGNVVEDLLTGSSAREHHEKGLAKRQIATLKVAQRYANAAMVAYNAKTGPPPNTIDLISALFSVRDTYMWRSANILHRINWSAVHSYYTHLVLALWNVYGPFVHTIQATNAGDTQGGNALVTQLIRFAMGWLYFLTEKPPVVYEDEMSGSTTVVTATDEFLQRHIVPSTHLTSISGGSITYQQGWINRQYNNYVTAISVACELYAQDGRLGSLAWEAIERAAAASQAQPHSGR